MEIDISLNEGFDFVNDRTGFANGNEFDSKEEVREYFVDEDYFKDMYAQTGTEPPTKEELEEMADLVIVKSSGTVLSNETPH